jgi:hypothetical protein
MRRLLLAPLAVAAALAVAATPASAGLSAKTRSTTKTYVTGGNSPASTGDITLQGNEIGYVTIPIQLREYQIELSMTDKTGLPVLAEVKQRIAGQDFLLGTVCGKTTKPIKLRKAGVNVMVLPTADQCGGSVSMPTSGTVTAKIYRPR